MGGSNLWAHLALADPPDGKGQPGATEEKKQGQPENPNGFGTVVSQKASHYRDVGEHSSSQEEPRQDVGNVARNDGAEGDHLATMAASSAVWTTRSEPTPTALPMPAVILDVHANNVNRNRTCREEGGE
jgi:hypothetical protein